MKLDKRYRLITELCEKLGNGKKFQYQEVYIQQCKKNYLSIAGNIEDVNQLYQLLYEGEQEGDVFQIVYTPKGYISKWMPQHNLCCYSCTIVNDSHKNLKGIILNVLIHTTLYKFWIGSFKSSGKHKGVPSFNKFYELCEEAGINLKDYIVENGEEVKSQIEKPIIRFYYPYLKKEIKNVHHLDLHSAWPSSIIKKHPEFKPIFEKLYSKSKDYCNLAVGMMQSKNLPYTKAKLPAFSLSNLAKDGINGCNEIIHQLSEEMYNAGCEIIGYNTDGIWYSGPVFHNKDEGRDFGNWRNDHINVTLYPYSDGTYYYEDEEGFHPVARGYYEADKLYSRDEWTKDIFFKQMLLGFRGAAFITGQGFILLGGSNRIK